MTLPLPPSLPPHQPQPFRVLALLVDYHSTADAKRLALELLRSTPTEGLTLQIVHIDNSNPTNLSALPQKDLPDDFPSPAVTLLRTHQNLGYAGALNRAIGHFDPAGQHFDAYWCLNCDLSLKPDCLSKLAHLLKQHPKTAAVGPQIYLLPPTPTTPPPPPTPPPLKLWAARGIVSPWQGTTAQGPWRASTADSSPPLPHWSYLPGCTLMVRAQAYHQIKGGLPSVYHLYFEETEFCVRLQKLGWDLRVSPQAMAFHRVDSLAHQIPARHFAYYFTRNQLLFWQRVFAIPWWLQLPRSLLVIAKEVLLPLRRCRSRTQVLDRLRYTLLGLLDGITLARGRAPRFEPQLFELAAHKPESS